MVSSVNSSTKAFLGFTVAAVAIVTVLFYSYSYRVNAAAQSTAPSLDKGRFSFLAGVPLIGFVYNYFNPTKPKLTLVTCPLGSRTMPFTNVDDLAGKLVRLKEQHETINTLVIYGKNLLIIEDPGILALNPMKVILVGVQTILNYQVDSLDALMVKSGWHADKFGGVDIIEVNSEEDAIEAILPVNPETFKPIPTVYSVKATENLI